MGFKLFVFAFAVLGYYLFYAVCIRKNLSYFPVFIISFLSVVTYITGILGSLDTGVRLTVMVGYVCLITAGYLLFRQRTVTIASVFLTPHVMFLLLGFIWVYYITRDLNPSHFDDYSHWYRICKMMNAEHAFPTQPDMRYPTYLPGTATWIYIVTRFIPFSPQNCYFAQNLINISCISSLFSLVSGSFSRRVKAACFAYIAAAAVLLGAMNLGTYELLVDSVLALVPLASVIVLLNEEEKDLKIWFLIVIEGIFVSLIKTTGVLFVLFVAIVWAMKREKEQIKIGKRSAMSGLIMVVLSFAATRLYLIRASRIYGDLTETSQSQSIKRYARIVSGKTPSYIMGIVRKFLSEVFLMEGGIRQIKIIWLCLFCIIVICVIKKLLNMSWREEKFIAAYLGLFFVVFSLGLLLVYIFSMDPNEATADRLVCFYRYMGTPAVFMSGVLFYCILKNCIHAPLSKQVSYVALSMSIMLLIGTGIVNTGYIWGYNYYSQEVIYNKDSWDLCRQYVPEETVFSDKKYVVIWDPDDFSQDNTSKIPFMMECYLRSPFVVSINRDDILNGNIVDKTVEYMQRCDYLVTLGDFSQDYDLINKYISIDSCLPGVNQINKPQMPG